MNNKKVSKKLSASKNKKVANKKQVVVLDKNLVEKAFIHSITHPAVVLDIVSARKSTDTFRVGFSAGIAEGLRMVEQLLDIEIKIND